MRRVTSTPVTTLVTTLVATFAFGSGVSAGTTGGDTNGGSVNLYANAVVSSGGGGGSGPVCVWKALTRGDVGSIGGGSNGPGLTAEEQSQPATTIVGGVTFYTYAVTCPGQGTQLRLVNPNTTAADLFELIRREASARIPAPVHDMNPAPAVGGIVNLGLWLAVEQQSIAPIHAEAGAAWITANPTLTDVSFDMGTGDDPVRCGGVGVPYPEGSNDPDEGPCGYTYRQKLPDDAAYTITITSEWTIPYTSSSGPGTLTAITTSTTYQYDVDEIQTVGSS
jgi:hypothetical protein